MNTAPSELETASDSPLALDAGALAEALRARRWRCVDVTAAALQRIAALDSTLHAFCTLDADGALAQAAAVDAALAGNQPVGPLAGVPVAVKDLISTRGLRTTYGSRLYQHFVRVDRFSHLPRLPPVAGDDRV